MADQRIQSTEEMVGEGHATKADTLNRLAVVEHENDGKHTRSTYVEQGSDPPTGVNELAVYSKDDGSGNNELYVKGESEGTPLKLTKTKGTELNVSAGLPKGYVQGWKMTAGTDTVNDVDFAIGKGRADDDSADIETTGVLTLALDSTGAGGRQAADTLTNGSFWRVYMIGGGGNTVKPFAVKSGSSVTLPGTYTIKAHLNYVYYKDGTVGIIGFEHGEDGVVRFKDGGDVPEDLDTTSPATTWTNVTLTIHADILLPLISFTGANHTTESNNHFNAAIRPDTWDWKGGQQTEDPVPGLAVNWHGNSLDTAAQVLSLLPAPGGIVEYKSKNGTISRIRIYVMGFYNGPYTP